MIQNNKALKLTVGIILFMIRLRVIQNNKALKQKWVLQTVVVCLRVIQNNKALKPQIRLKAARRRAVSCILAIL